MSSKKLYFVTLLGHPGSGKTYVAERLAKEFGWFHLNSDRLRLEMWNNPKHAPDEHTALFRVMDYLTEELLKRGVSVVYDANSIKFEYRQRLRQIAKRTGAHFRLLYLATPVNLALRRVKQRRKIKHPGKKKYYRPIPASTVYRLRDATELPSHEKRIMIDGTKKFPQLLPEIERALR